MNLPGIDLLSASRPHQDSQSNLVLAGLSRAAHSLIDKRLEERKFPEGTLIWDCSDPPGQVVFPCSGMISVRVVMRDGLELLLASGRILSRHQKRLGDGRMWVGMSV